MFKWPWKADDESGNAEMPWEQALAIPVLAHLSPTEQRKLTQLAARFLQQKRLVALQGLELTPLHQARIALLFCLPVLELGIEWLDGFHEVLIYPAPFVVDDEWEDDIGLVHNQRVVQSGQSWQQGPVVLNWLDIQDSFDASGFNLVVHEVAHKLDTRNGDRASGVPLIPLREVAGWEHDLHAAYISHISHVTSFALALTVLEKEREERHIFDLAGGGFESTVRLAKSSAATWVPILLQNKYNVLDVLREHIHQLQIMRRMLERDDTEGLCNAIERANTIQRIIH